MMCKGSQGIVEWCFNNNMLTSRSKPVSYWWGDTVLPIQSGSHPFGGEGKCPLIHLAEFENLYQGERGFPVFLAVCQ